MRMRAVSTSSIVLRSVMPSDAAMTVAVVQAMPFVVKTRLYGAASPVRWRHMSWRTESPRSAPVTSPPW